METNRRILIIDDNEEVHKDIRKVLLPSSKSSKLDEMTDDILGKSREKEKCSGYEIDSAFQGEEGLAKVKQAEGKGRPYALAFVDVRIPPGLDGVETAKRLREIAPELAIVIITAYSDYSWEQIAEKIENLEDLFIIKKPFDSIEIRQSACALTEKWNMARSLDESMEDLNREKENFLNILESMEDGVYIVDQEHNIKYVNPVLVQEFGAFQGRKCYDYFHGREADCPWCRNEEVFAGKTVRWEWFFPKTKKTYDLLGTPLKQSDGSIKKLEIFRDITDRKEIEKERLTVKKLEAAAIFSSGIAHDFNNLLAIILGYTGLVMETLEKSSPIHPQLQHVLDATLQCKKLSHKFLSFSSGGEMPVLKVVSLQKVASAAVSHALNGSEMTCQYHFPDNLWPVEVDSDQMHQAITNVTINCREAMSGKGMIKVSAKNTDSESIRKESGYPVRNGKYVRLDLEDHGKGIDKDDLEKIFDPYFSTKRRGVEKGMGLGLSLAYSIINKHGGHIQVESEPHAGTTVTIYLPAYEA